MIHRENILEARAEADRLHNKLGSQASIEKIGGGVDVFGAIHSQDVPLLFKRLDKLLGAYFPRPEAGIMITSERSLAIQRFTGAHELGHHVLGHQASFDKYEILDRDSSRTKYDPVEMAADAFAAEFLLPDWVFGMHAERQGWNADSLTDPSVVYQLSLRVGASFEATLRQLRAYDYIDPSTYRKFRSIQPKTIKQKLLQGQHLDKWSRDVWLLTSRDQGTQIQGGPNDVFLFELRQNSGAGYLWTLDQLAELGFTVMSDEVRVPEVEDSVGGPVRRMITAMSTQSTSGKLRLQESRPWASDDVGEVLDLRVALFQERGLPQLEREALAA